jgi:hypothetical protein
MSIDIVDYKVNKRTILPKIEREDNTFSPKGITMHYFEHFQLLPFRTKIYSKESISNSSIPNSNKGNLQQIIEDSRYMLSLEDNWDECGAKKISEKTWLLSVNFLIKINTIIEGESIKNLIPPSIGPVTDGSIDFTWITNKARMLINFKNSEINTAHYYADLYSDNNSAKGNFDPTKNIDFILPWMKLFS